MVLEPRQPKSEAPSILGNLVVSVLQSQAVLSCTTNELDEGFNDV
jgi:hypothetical protein